MTEILEQFKGETENGDQWSSNLKNSTKIQSETQRKMVGNEKIKHVKEERFQ